VIKAATTPAHLPVFTENTMRLGVNLYGGRQAQALTSCSHGSVVKVASGGDPTSAVILG